MPDDTTSTGVATALGAHAVALWAATVALAVLVAMLAWRWRRLASAGRDGAASPAGVAVRAGAGFALVVAVAALLAALFAELAEGHRAGERIGEFDDALALAVRQHTPGPVLRVAAGLTHAGDPAVLTVLGAGIGLALLRSGRRALALAWVAAVLGNAVLNRTLKEVFRRVRPPHDTMLATADGFSFPSGHTSGSLVAYGMLAYVAVRVLPPAWHAPALCVAVVVAVTTAFSRVFLGVHYASDVLAGAISGGAWLLVCIAAVEWHRRRGERRAG